MATCSVTERGPNIGSHLSRVHARSGGGSRACGARRPVRWLRVAMPALHVFGMSAQIRAGLVEAVIELQVQMMRLQVRMGLWHECLGRGSSRAAAPEGWPFWVIPALRFVSVPQAADGSARDEPLRTRPIQLSLASARSQIDAPAHCIASVSLRMMCHPVTGGRVPRAAVRRSSMRNLESSCYAGAQIEP
jgi:hypothetical protein